MKNVISATCNNCGAKYDNLIKGVTPGSKITLYGCDKCVGLGEVEAKVVTVSGEPTKFVDKPSQDTVSIEDIMHATPKGRETVMKAIENSIEVQNKMTKKAQNTLKESNNLNTSEEHIKDTSLDEQNKYWQSQFRDILGDSNALDVSYAIPYLFAQIAPLAKTRNEHDRQTRKINALAFAIDDYLTEQQTKLLQVIEDEVKAQPTWELSTMIDAESLLEALKKIKERYE